MKIAQAEFESEIATQRPSRIFDTEISPWRSFAWPRQQLDPLDLVMMDRLRARIYDFPDFQIYSVYNPRTVLLGKGFNTLLYAARNGALSEGLMPQGIDGVVADWVYIDHNAYLQQHHSVHLGKHWSNFMRFHRDRFVWAISEPTQAKAKEFFEANLIRFVNARYAETLQDEVENLLRASEISVHAGPLEMRDVRLVGHRRIPFAQLPPVTQDSLIRDFRGERNLKKTIIDCSSQEGVIEEDNGYPQKRISYSGGGLVKVQFGNSWSVISLEDDESKIIEKYFEEGEQTGLIPRVLWAKMRRNGQKFYLDGEIPDYLEEDIDPRTDTLAGLILATYLSPSERDSLPKKMGYTPWSWPKQKMREAQIPVLVSIFRDRILNGHFVHQAESSLLNLSK